MIQQPNVVGPLVDSETEIRTIETLDAAAIANQNVVPGKRCDELIQSGMTVTSRKEKVGCGWKSLNMFHLLKVFPKPDPFPLDQLQRRLGVRPIVQTGNPGNFSEIVDLPGFTVLQE